jgi:zeaxanthin glucosyltransferase
MSLREVPSALAERRVDALIIDEIVLPGPTIAQMLHLPYFLISTSVPHNFGWVPPPGYAWCNPSTSMYARVRNRLLQVSVFQMRGPIRRKLNDLRRKSGLESIGDIQRVFPELAHITQLPEYLDFPRSMLPSNFYYSGPFVEDAARPYVDFPWSQLDGRPLVYVSLGTSQDSRTPILRIIAQVCLELDLQLVISLGGRREPEHIAGLPGQPLIVKYAPQLELLKKAHVVITHAGLNSVLETLMEGKPMIAIPMTHDQPVVAACLARLKIAEVITVKMLSANRLRLALTRLLNDINYRDNALQAQARIRSAPGLERAVEVIESSLDEYFRGRSSRIQDSRSFLTASR